MTAQFPTTRLRRLRKTPQLRQLVAETSLQLSQFILPLFIRHGRGANQPISTMPGLYQITLENLPQEIDEITALGIPAIMLFGIPETKDATGSDAYNEHGIVQQAIRLIKKQAPTLLVISDLCCCEYTDHGHCGIMRDGDVDNDATLTILQQQALSHAQAGVDMVAPSGMIDGMIGAIRTALDQNSFTDLPILSYTAKYASCLYAPFRAAAGGSAPKQGDRKTHQMNPANAAEAIREAELDVAEGADILMVKPASIYLDVIYQVKQAFPTMPLAAYQVGGEYAMIHAAAQKGWLDLDAIMWESLLAIKRAGADIIISYFAKDVARRLNSK